MEHKEEVMGTRLVWNEYLETRVVLWKIGQMSKMTLKFGGTRVLGVMKASGWFAQVSDFMDSSLNCGWTQASYVSTGNNWGRFKGRNIIKEILILTGIQWQCGEGDSEGKKQWEEVMFRVEGSHLARASAPSETDLILYGGVGVTSVDSTHPKWPVNDSFSRYHGIFARFWFLLEWFICNYATHTLCGRNLTTWEKLKDHSRSHLSL